MMHGERLSGRGLTAHYFFTFGVAVQVVGDRTNTKVEHRILHLDAAAAVVKLIQKGSVKVVLRFDTINQIVYDDAEPRSVLISCSDDRRYFIVFQSAEDNLVFRTACSDLTAGHLDPNRFQRAVLKKGQLMKRGKAGALFGDRYAILTPRKLFLLRGKVSVFPSNAISLEEVSPRFDDSKGTIHLDVCGKEYVLQGTDKEVSQEWFVEIARAATSRVHTLMWDDSTAEKMKQEAEAAAQYDNDEVEELNMAGIVQSAHGSFYGGAAQSPSHFTSPEDWDHNFSGAPEYHLDLAVEHQLGQVGQTGPQHSHQDPRLTRKQQQHWTSQAGSTSSPGGSPNRGRRNAGPQIVMQGPSASGSNQKGCR